MKTKLSIIIIFCAIAANCFLQSCTTEAPHEKIVDNHQPKIITDLERINNYNPQNETFRHSRTSRLFS